MRAAAGNVGEAGAEIEAAARGRAIVDTGATAGRAVCGGIVGSGVAMDGAHRIGLADRDRDAAALVPVIGTARERPVRAATRDVDERRAEAQDAARGSSVDRNAHTAAGCAVRSGIVASAVAGD